MKDKKISKKKKEVELLKEEIETLKKDKLLLLAEFQNFRRKKQEESLKIKEKAVIDFALDLLPSIDNFEMSLKMSDDKKMFILGVELIHKNIVQILKDNKIEEFYPTIGEKFNPHHHDPILIEDKSSKSGEVLKIVKKGYKFKDKIILPSKVEVVKG